MSKVISKDGTEIAFDRIGEGLPVILVDGALCYRNSGPMTPLSHLLAPHFTVFTYDRRGRGESGDTSPYAIEREVEDIEALINEAGGSAYVYGISSGAGLSIKAATQLAGIKKLALYEPPFIVDNTRAALPHDYEAHMNELVNTGRRGDALEYFMVVGVGVPAEMVAGMRHMPMWPGLETIAPTLVNDTAIMEENHWRPIKEAASITIPTLIMDGGASPEWMHNGAKTVQNTIPGTQYRTLPDQTHEVAAEALAPALVEFFGA